MFSFETQERLAWVKACGQIPQKIALSCGGLADWVFSLKQKKMQPQKKLGK